MARREVGAAEGHPVVWPSDGSAMAGRGRDIDAQRAAWRSRPDADPVAIGPGSAQAMLAALRRRGVPRDAPRPLLKVRFSAHGGGRLTGFSPQALRAAGSDAQLGFARAVTRAHRRVRHGGRQATSRRRSMRSAGTFCAVRSSGEMAKTCAVHNSRRTSARASLKVGSGLGTSARTRPPVHARRQVGSPTVSRGRTARAARAWCAGWPGRTTAAGSPCRGDGGPPRRWSRSASGGRTSAGCRPGSARRSVQRKACGSFSPLGSRTSTQRIATRMPGWCQSAVPEAMSSRRVVRPYQPSMVTRRQGVRRLRTRSARLGSRAPLTGGRPRVRGRRGGGGSHRQASRRSG